VAPAVARWLIDNYRFESLLEIGCGKGNLVNALLNIDSSLRIEAIEPDAEIANDLPCRVWRCHAQDFVASQRFDLVVSFEVVEHVEREAQAAFWASMLRAAPIVFGSIHTGGPITEYHRTILSSSEWQDWFHAQGYQWRAVPSFAGAVPKSWCASAYYDVRRLADPSPGGHAEAP
jgi:hypothetical protein